MTREDLERAAVRLEARKHWYAARAQAPLTAAAQAEEARAADRLRRALAGRCKTGAADPA